MKYQQPNPSEPITIYGLSQAGPIEISAVDGNVHVALGDQGVYLDRPGADHLIRALVASMVEAAQ